jgi:phosphoglycerol transferase MdoB-like AlkP superfamily enzyme
MDRPIAPGLAGVLKGRGYRTAFLSAANPEWGGMDWIARGAGFGQVIGPEQLGGPAASSWGTQDGVLIDGLLNWVDAGRATGRPFFVTAWTDQTHDPYTLDAGTPQVNFVDPPAHRHAADENRYLSAIRQVDRHLGRLFAGLRQRGIADDTLVVITGDHGEAFGDRHDTNGHGAALFDECVRVPMMIWNPRTFKGERDLRVGSHVDIGPTIAHVLGVEPLPHWQGASLFSPDHPGRAYAVIDVAAYQFAAIDAGHKYILNATAGAEHLFDLRADPMERRDVGKEQGGTLEQMRGRVRAFVKAEDGYLDASK